MPALYGPDEQCKRIRLTKKRATFGPISPVIRMPGTPNPGNCLEITLFSTGCDPASMQACSDRLRIGWVRRGCETLGLVSFSGPAQALGAAVDKLACDHDRGGNRRSLAQVPGKPWRSKGTRA